MRWPSRNELIALTALIAAGCASAPAPAPAPPPRAVLAPRALSESEIETIAAILRDEDERRFDAERFGAWLKHGSPEVRRRAALAAGRIGESAALPLLLDALGDAEPAVAANAAYAVGLLGDTSAAVVLALSSRVGAVWSADDDRAVEAVRALGMIGGPAATAALRQMFERYQPGAGADLPRRRGPAMIPAAARAALLASARLPRAVAPVEPILAYLGTDDSDVRWRATYALARLRAPAAVGPLIDMTRDSIHLVRETAVRLLDASLADAVGRRPAALAVLITALGDQHQHVRVNAANALADYTEAEAVAALADRARNDPEPHVRLAAITALGGRADSAAAATLVAVARAETDPFALRAAALNALRGVDAAAARAEALRWTTASEPRYRLRGLQAMTGDAAPDSVLDRMSRDSAPEVAAAAVRALAARGDSTPPYARLIRMLAEPDYRIRAAALDALAGRVTAADLPILLDAYERALLDAEPAAAIAAAGALARLAETGTPVARAFFLRFPAPPNPAVHRVVARRLEPGPWGEPPRETPPEIDYVRVVRDLVAPVVAGEPPPVVELVMPAGDITIELHADEAPLAVHNFLSLIDKGFYYGGERRRPPAWHRVVPNFVIQDGDPGGTGGGGPGYSIRDEPSRLRYGRAAVGMALRGRDTAGSQFFIALSPQPHLDGAYTLFGRVVAGMEIADRTLPGDTISAFVRAGSNRAPAPR